MNRREFLVMTTAGLSAIATRGTAGSEAGSTSMGIVQYSFSRSEKTNSALSFLEYCHSLGAGGVQVTLDSTAPEYAAKIHQRCEELGMYFEAIFSLPQTDNVGEFEQRVIAAKQAGALCIRSACLPTRRYETFSTLDDWRKFTAESRERIRLALPILERQKIPLALENHKDWTADELVSLLNQFGSEWLGACIDMGNNIALLDDPMEVVEKLAPYAVSTHIKDMAVEEYTDGFRLAEVPLGAGMLDLKRIVTTVSRRRPGTKFSLEMITRDPLDVPCLTDKYWITFPSRSGMDLARTLRWVRAGKPAEPLPRISKLDPAARLKVEEENVGKCLLYAREHLGLTA